MENLEEEQERENKGNNIMFNVSERLSVNDDREKCEEVSQKKLGVKDAKIKRIGRITTRKVYRPVIVDMNEVGMKCELVKRSKKLGMKCELVKRSKKLSNYDYQKTKIAPDLTKREREENDRLREELKDKTEDNG
ncbi:hypothetical protein Pcinc_038411 [Petrolisthes cinctipes]|uniref:Uncharacterized protein n=1 Tax=Petrolisthes cinctipes TaxID=88211 RepID=A0AAE1EK28_PETCI|nr:hypothetical protein Pcinc_038411 [Petrolisthes cinctipes]